MVTGDESHRTLVRRQNKMLALYLSLVCWQKRVDGVVLSRLSLSKYFGLQRFKEERISWIRNDFEDLFIDMNSTVYNNSMSDLYFSRYLFSHEFPIGPMSTFTRLRLIRENSKLKFIYFVGRPLESTEFFEEKPSILLMTLPSEEEVMKNLALVFSGLEGPSVLIPKEEKSE